MPIRFLLLLFPAALMGQMLNPSLLLKPPTNAWPTYNGDYSGRRFSPLNLINESTIDRLNLAWVFRVQPGDTPGSIGGGVADKARAAQFLHARSNYDIKSTPLMVDGILYFTTTDNTWAVDARSGRELWHYYWRSLGGIHIGNRGIGMYGNWLYFETPDDYLVSLDARTGKERWHIKIADYKQEYFSTPAPVVVGDHVIVGTGGDSLDVPGFLEARDPKTGKLQWRWWTEPLKKGDPGSDSWPNIESMRHGGGMTWVPGTYDPQLHLYYLGTGNPNPVMAGQSRKGKDLFTCTIVALNVDTGKLVWYFQASSHDTHDWDAVQTPVLIDGTIDGKPRKLLAQASRNGYFFLLDRTNGKDLVSKPYIDTLNWSLGEDSKGHPIPNHDKDPKVDGVLVSPASGGGTNWPSPTFDPQTGLFYVSALQSFAEFYLTDTSKHPQGYGATQRQAGNRGTALRAIDYKTGKTVWKHKFPVGEDSGLLSTAGKLLFSGDGADHLVAFDPANGHILWHAGLGANVSNGPETFTVDGKQYLVVGAGDSLYAFTLAH
ncbi:MAG TPA: acido-empty-quinoprotein group A [Bryobacteraceae bacterium]